MVHGEDQDEDLDEDQGDDPIASSVPSNAAAAPELEATPVETVPEAADDPYAHLFVRSDEPTRPRVDAPPQPASPSEWVAEDGPSDWLPGTWVVDAPAAPRRRANRGLEKSLARQEKKLRDAERRNARRSRKRRRRTADEDAPPVGRIPAQPDATVEERPDVRGRRERRQRRRDDLRAQALSGEDDPDLVPSGPVSTEMSEPGTSSGRTRRRRRGRGAGGESGENTTVSGTLSDTASMSTLGVDPVQTGPGEDAEGASTQLPDATPSQAERRAARRQARRDGRAEIRAAAIGEQLAAEAARAERDELARQARAEKRERRLDQKVARKAAAAARRERRAGDAAARRAARDETPVETPAETPSEALVQEPALADPRPSADDTTAPESETTAARVRRVEEKVARAAARAEQKAARLEAEAEERRRRAEEKVARAAAEAEERQRQAEEKAAREAAEAEERRRQAEDKAAADAAARAAEERHRLEEKLARLEARATARADKEAERLARRTARADAKAMADAAALDRRQDRRAQRIEKRRARADAKSAKEIADLERRRERRARRLEKRSARARVKARQEAERLEQRRAAIDHLAELVPAEFPADIPADAAPTPAAESAPTPPEDESLAHYLGRVEASILPWRSRRSRSRVPGRVRRAARIGAVCVLIGGAAVLPWAAPQVAGVIADALPGGDTHAATVKDPPVAPRTKSLAGPVGIATEANPLQGKRLASAGQPRRVQVPRLHVDSTVVPISGQSGSLLPPDDPQILGWWREGKPVGAEFGTAVITGHTVHTGGGALDNLDKLAVGDTLRVQTDAGEITYVVQRARIYSTAELARNADDIFRLSGPGRLVVITCDDWNGTFYESNAVVFASPTGDDPVEGEGVGNVPDPGPGEP